MPRMWYATLVCCHLKRNGRRKDMIIAFKVVGSQAFLSESISDLKHNRTKIPNIMFWHSLSCPFTWFDSEVLGSFFLFCLWDQFSISSSS